MSNWQIQLPPYDPDHPEEHYPRLVKQPWRCPHCGFEAPTQTSCCYAHWEEAADAKAARVMPWVIGFGVLALGFFVIIVATRVG